MGLRALSRLLDLAAALGMGTTAERPRITVVPTQHNVKIARATGAPIVLPRTPRQRRQQRRLVGIALVAAWPLVSQIARRPSTKSAQPVVRLGARPYWWFRDGFSCVDVSTQFTFVLVEHHQAGCWRCGVPLFHLFPTAIMLLNVTWI